ncbi:hypothetical protein, partial [Serratia marcescens]|uniref:hypothetical protein n=1 Tax=Serratia marcescens TaxID=615 RepID=UPI001C3761BB
DKALKKNAESYIFANILSLKKRRFIERFCLSNRSRTRFLPSSTKVPLRGCENDGNNPKFT